jgi:hypothetical protein
MMLLRNMLMVILAQICFFPLDFVVAAKQDSQTYHHWKDEVMPASPPNIAAPHLNQRDGSNQSIASTNSTLTKLQNIVQAAQEEAAIRNKNLVANPRKNIYQLRDFAIPRPNDTTTGTGVNQNVANAAAFVTEYLSNNGSVKPTLVERQTSSYWMENMIQNGESPYVGDSTYTVSLCLLLSPFRKDLVQIRI